MVMIYSWGRQLVFLFITFSLQLVGGNGSSCDGSFKCCSGYKWERNSEKCLPCEVGYYGIDCADPCPFPSFGNECQLFCNCSKDQCDHKKGCPKGDCGPGYADDFCDVKCRYPRFGVRCQGECFCEQKKCDPVNGCQDLHYNHDDINVLETSIESGAASMWNNLSEKKKGMVIRISTLGLLFLILTAMYIWVSHRIRVETNNLRKGKEELDENSAA